MPTYEYRCKDCLHELEAQQAFSDAPLTECPSCGGLLKKKFSSVGISFKGSGFYKTDSRSSTAKTNGKDKDKGDKSKDAESSASTSSNGSSDTSSSSGSSSDTKSTSSDSKAAAPSSA